MNCPTCKQPAPEGTAVCPSCAAELVRPEDSTVDVTIGKESALPARPSRPSWLVFGGVAAAVLAIGLTAWALVKPSPAAAELADRFPADSIFFAEIDVQELTSADSRHLVELFAPLIEEATGEPFDLDTLIDEGLAALDSELGEFDLSFDDDLASWATGPIAMAALPAEEGVPDRGALVVRGDNADALDEFLTKVGEFPDLSSAGTVEAGGVTFLQWAGPDETSVLAGRDGTDLVVATDAATAEAVVNPAPGSTLADVADISAQLARLPGNAALLFAVNGAEVDEAVTGFGLGESGLGWVTGSATSGPRGLRLDYVADVGDERPTYSDDLTDALPADTIAFFRIGDLIRQLSEVADSGELGSMAEPMEEELGISIEDVLSVFAVDGGLAVWPSTDPELPVNGALVGVSDMGQAEFVDRLASLAGSMGLMSTPVDGGVSFNGIASLGARDTLTILSTDGDLLTGAPSEPFSDGALAQTAAELVDGEIVFALDVPAIVDLVDGFMAMDDPEGAALLRCLPFGVTAGGVQVAGETLTSTVFVEVTKRC